MGCVSAIGSGKLSKKTKEKPLFVKGDMVLTYLAVQGVAFKCFDSVFIEEI